MTRDGTVNKLLLLLRVTAGTPGPAADFRVSVQLLMAPGPKVDGVQASVESNTDEARLIVVVPELFPTVAVTVAF